MKRLLQKLLCFVLGHAIYAVPLTNGHSFFGTYKCFRDGCTYQEDWQYDL